MSKRSLMLALVASLVLAVMPQVAHAGVWDPPTTGGPFDVRWIEGVPTAHDRIKLTIGFWPGFRFGALSKGDGPRSAAPRLGRGTGQRQRGFLARGLRPLRVPVPQGRTHLVPQWRVRVFSLLLDHAGHPDRPVDATGAFHPVVGSLEQGGQRHPDPVPSEGDPELRAG